MNVWLVFEDKDSPADDDYFGMSFCGAFSSREKATEICATDRRYVVEATLDALDSTGPDIDPWDHVHYPMAPEKDY